MNIQKRLSGRFFCPVRLYGLQPLRNSFQSIILTLTALCFFLRVGGCVTTAFSLCGNTNKHQTGLLRCSPRRLYHELLFLSHAALRTSTAPPLLSKYYPYPDCTLFFSSGQRLGYELLFCLMRQYEQAPDRPFEVFPSANVSRTAFLSRAALRTSTAPQLLSKYYPYPPALCFFGSAAASPTAFSLCGFTDMPQTGLLTCSPFKLLPVLILRKKIRLQMQPYFQIYARYQIKDLYKAMISSLVGSFGLPGRQASSMAD